MWVKISGIGLLRVERSPTEKRDIAEESSSQSIA
jgi:hypothetical protein